MKEIWKPIVWYEHIYQASNLWRIRRLPHYAKHPKWWLVFKDYYIMKWTRRPTWYMFVELKWKPFWIHRLIANAFLWLDLNNPHIYACHKNDIRNDNRVENLFVWSPRDNVIDMINKWRAILPKKQLWEKHWQSIFKEEDILNIRKLYIEWLSQKEIGIKYNCDQWHISRIVNRKLWGHI